MKKIIASLLVGMVTLQLTANLAEANEVHSNIVGFQKIELVPGYNFVGLNFRNPGEESSFDIQGLLDTSNLKGGTNQGGADQLFMWDAASQQYVELWLFDSDGQAPDFDGKWIDTTTNEVADRELFCGDGFWLINSDDEPVEALFSGEVESAEVFMHAALDGYNMLASAWPVDIAVNELDLEGLKGGTTQGGADQLFMWDAASQQYLELWLFDSGGQAPDYDGKWIDVATGEVADHTLSAGTAFWLIKQTDEQVTESRPF